MDVSVALRRAENLIRDTLHNVLSKSIGTDWSSNCGVSADRVAKWKERATEERRKKGHSDPRLIYYADFYDLRTIIRKSWQNGLAEIFEDLKEVEVLLQILEELRNPEAHRREFLPFEVELAAGILGRLRSRITRYYSQMDTSESHYPRFEFAQDSLGNAYSIGQGKSVTSQGTLRPGDEIQFKLVASDPLGEPLEYIVYPNAKSFVRAAMEQSPKWNRSGEFCFQIEKEYVGQRFIFMAAVRSSREFHADSQHILGPVDDMLSFSYEILPPRRVDS
jgi:hypothetical protein